MVNYKLTLKDLDIADFRYNINEYYKECFSILNSVDLIIQSLFRYGEKTYSFKHFNNKNYGIIIYNLVIGRLKYEHRFSDEDIKAKVDSEYGNVLNYEDCSMHFFIPPTYMHNTCTYDFYDSHRCSGRTTRLIDAYIQDSYLNIKENIIVTDHYGDNCSRFRGMNAVRNTASDRMLFENLRRRLERELPNPIFDSYWFSLGQNCIKLNIELPVNYAINYKHLL